MSSKRREGGGSFRNLDDLVHRLGGKPLTAKPRSNKPGKGREKKARACKAFLLNEHLSERARETPR